jgi:hypothetical protein
VIACSFFRGYSQPKLPFSASGNPLRATRALSYKDRITCLFRFSLISVAGFLRIASTSRRASFLYQEEHVKTWIEQKKKQALEAGKVGWVLLWLLGVPIPVLLILFLLRGCT